MERILLVDDSAFDLRYASGLLHKRHRWIVDTAQSGKEALNLIEREPFDVVVSDLVMPDTNGLDLLTAVRRRFPDLPVIIMTSRGSEEFAVQALQEGAASYLCKKNLAQDLVRVLDSVLTASSRERAHSRLLKHLTSGEFSFQLPNDQEMIFVAVRFLQEAAENLEILEQQEWTRLGIVLEETLSNAMIHGNLEVCSSLRAGDDGAYDKLIAMRRRKSPYRDRVIQVTATFHRERAKFVIRDDGPGFDRANIPDPLDPENLNRPFGRGLFLIHQFMDEVRHNDKGNEITLVKHRGPGETVTTRAAESEWPGDNVTG